MNRTIKTAAAKVASTTTSVPSRSKATNASPTTSSKPSKKTSVRKARKPRVTKSKLYNKLDRVIGTWNLRVASSTKVGVKVSTRGTKKGSVVEMILPSTTPQGLPCTVRVSLSGRQARAIMETLSDHKSKI